MAEMDSSNYPALKSLVSLETTVPGEEDGVTFTSFGEGLSYDGLAVGFWAGWGDELEPILLCYPKTGNKARRDFCLNKGGGGDPNTVCDNSTAPDGCDSGCYQNKTVLVNQGIFVYDSEDDSKLLQRAARRRGQILCFGTTLASLLRQAPLTKQIVRNLLLGVLQQLWLCLSTTALHTS